MSACFMFLMIWLYKTKHVLHLQIINRDDVQEAAREIEGYFIKSGIVTVIKDAVIPSGMII